MLKIKNLISIRIIVGTIIMIHGLVRVAFISDYVNFVLNHFGDLFTNDSVLIIGATFLPFLEFLAGTFILFKVSIKKSLVLALSISLLMTFFIFCGDLHYYRLIYHTIVMTGIIFLLYKYKDIVLHKNSYKFPEGEIYSRRD